MEATGGLEMVDYDKVVRVHAFQLTGFDVVIEATIKQVLARVLAGQSMPVEDAHSLYSEFYKRLFDISLRDIKSHDNARIGTRQQWADCVLTVYSMRYVLFDKDIPYFDAKTSENSEKEPYVLTLM